MAGSGNNAPQEQERSPKRENKSKTIKIVMKIPNVATPKRKEQISASAILEKAFSFGRLRKAGSDVEAGAAE